MENKTINFAAVGLAHTHIYGMCQGLIDAGAKLNYVFDIDKNLTADFIKKFPNVQVCDNLSDILTDDSITLIASADIPSNRANLAAICMTSGKDFFVDKAPFIN